MLHGAEDAIIPVSESDRIVRKLREMDFKVKYSRYEGIGHNAWESPYSIDASYN